MDVGMFASISNQIRVVVPDHALSAIFADGTAGIVLDPTRMDTMWQDAARSVPVTTSGDPVRVWVDAMGSGIAAEAINDALRPIWQDGTGQGFSTVVPYLDFNGTKSLDLPDVTFNYPAQAMFVRAESTVSSKVIISSPHAGTHTIPYFRSSLYHIASGKNESRWNGVVRTASGTAFGSGLYNMLGGDPGNGIIWRNGVSQFSGSVITLTYPNNQGVIIGANASGGEKLVGKVFGICIFDRASTTDDRALLTAWNDPT